MTLPTEMPAVPTHRNAPSVSMMAGSKLLQAPFNHDVVVAQIGAICTSLQDRRIVVSAWIIESGGRDGGDSLL